MKQNVINVALAGVSFQLERILTTELSKDEGISVIGAANSYATAMATIEKLNPDVVLLDFETSQADALAFIEKMKGSRAPVPTVGIGSVTDDVVKGLRVGATDFVLKPDLAKAGTQTFISELTVKIKFAHMAKASKERTQRMASTGAAIRSQMGGTIDSGKLIAIGASTGGTEALFEVLTALPENVPPILIVQHMPAGFTRMFADRLDKNCKFEVKEAQNGDVVKQGRAILAAGDSHLRLVKDGSGYKISSAPGERVSGHCPSVDVMFTSVAEVADNSKVIGVILTGMGGDGAEGLLKMKNKGAYTIGQDEQSCIVYGMPKVAFMVGAVRKQLPLSQIASEIVAQSFK